MVSQLPALSKPKLRIVQCPARFTSLSPPPNYGAVEDGIIFRSGFPQAKHLEFIESLKICSVLYVRAHTLPTRDDLADYDAAPWSTQSQAKSFTSSWTDSEFSAITLALLRTRTEEKWISRPFATRSFLRRTQATSQYTSTATRASIALGVWSRAFENTKDGQWMRSC